MSSIRSDDISRLVREHGPFMERLAGALTASAADAEDLLHDTWVEAIRHGVGTMRSERGWLTTTMRRRAGALRRKLRPNTGLLGKGEAADLEAPAELAPAAVAQRMEAERLIGDALGALEEPHRTAIYLRYRKDWTPTQIAAETGAPVKTVKTQLYRGLELLRRDLDAMVAAPDERNPRGRWMALVAPVGAGARRVSATAAAAPPWLAAFVMKKVLLAASLILILASAVWLVRSEQVVPAGSEVSVSASTELSARSHAPVAAEVDPLGREAVVDRVGNGESAAPLPLESASIVVSVVTPEGDSARMGSVVVERETGDGLRQIRRIEPVNDVGVARFVDVVPGTYEILDAITMARERATVEPGAEVVVTIHRRSDMLSRVRGQVLDPEGQSVPGATVWGRRTGPLLPVGVTDDEGRFEVQAHENGELQASVPNRLPSDAVRVSALDGDSVDGRSCTLVLGETSARLRGVVVDMAGDPVAGALVTAGPLERRWLSETSHSAQPVTVLTDEIGRFEYGQGLPEGDWRVGAVTPDGRGMVQVVHFGSVDLELRLVIQPGTTFEGTVLRVDGSPAIGGYVAVRPLRKYPEFGFGVLGTDHHARVDAAGHYRLEGVLGFELDLLAGTAYGEARQRKRVQVLSLAPGDVRLLDFQLSDQPLIAGVVVDKEGLPIPDVVIRAHRSIGGNYGDFIATDSAGRFQLTAMESRADGADRWEIKAEARSQGATQVLGEVVGVRFGAEDVRIVATRPVPEDAFVTGRVVVLGEEIPAKVDFVIWREEDDSRKTRTGSFIEVDRRTGAFHHGPVAAGTYRITAGQGDLQFGIIEGIVVGAGETVLAPDLVID
ncbi:ECF RNA polymerase sigma factor SigL [Planctomycetes bacterium Poly30]|uniref:ECF RNA polymerase sigma factor SigL n=1 Tax=Saltatorellus ferox TaxID=2528018 RepID=A0A518EVM4_9BACT|nr:ECF RNA polymerase sigma factor SigL [Planctomycetes bacterium Poly30]